MNTDVSAGEWAVDSGDEGGDGGVAEEAEAERGHIAAAHRATEPHHANLGWRRNWENVRLSTHFNNN